MDRKKRGVSSKGAVQTKSGSPTEIAAAPAVSDDESARRLEELVIRPLVAKEKLRDPVGGSTFSNVASQILLGEIKYKIDHGKKFPGRKPESFSALKKLVIKTILAAIKKGGPTSEIKPAILWRRFCDTQPVGFTFSGKPTEAGANVWIDADRCDRTYHRFATIVGEAKKHLRQLGKIPN
jgi:hypothetical protein